MAEFAKSKLFYFWLLGKYDSEQSGKPSGIILRPEDFEIALEPDEYLEGLSYSLAGEIGRFAVEQGTGMFGCQWRHLIWHPRGWD
jgi:predicted translin family RNA/ssDNA-binding protein